MAASVTLENVVLVSLEVRDFGAVVVWFPLFVK